MYSEIGALNETITTLIEEINNLKNEIIELKNVQKLTNEKLYTLNEHISTLDLRD